MNEILLENLKKGWKKDQGAGTASMTLGGLIQFAGSQAEKKRHLDKIKFATDSEIEGDPTALEGDFVDVTYRALTAAMMGDRALDFGNEGVLRRSVPLLKGQTVFKDHNTRVDNWVGQVAETFWDDKTKGIPPGINAVLRLDTVKDPMTVRGVLQGALHSASVTVSFEWAPSHPKLMDDNNFWNNLGEEMDGEIVRILVTKILKYWEISLVWQGADEYAKQIDAGGKALNRYCYVPEWAQEQSGVENFTLTNDPKTEASTVKFTTTQDLEQEESMKLKTELEKLVGTFNDDNVREVVEAFTQKKVDEAKAEASKAIDLASQESAELKAKVEELEARKAELSQDAALGKAYLEEVRKDVVALYTKAKGEKGIKDVFLKTFEKADLELLKAWREDYQKEVDEKYPLKCGCGSKVLSRQSSQLEDAVEGKLISFNSPAAESVRKLHG